MRGVAPIFACARVASGADSSSAVIWLASSSRRASSSVSSPVAQPISSTAVRRPRVQVAQQELSEATAVQRPHVGIEDLGQALLLLGDSGG